MLVNSKHENHGEECAQDQTRGSVRKRPPQDRNGQVPQNQHTKNEQIEMVIWSRRDLRGQKEVHHCSSPMSGNDNKTEHFVSVH